MISFGVIDWVVLDHAAKDAVMVGDIVSTDAGGMPAYRVVALQGGRAWLRNDEHPFDWILPVSSFLWKARRAA